MNNAPQAYQEWLRVVSQKMSHLSKPQAVVLSMWSLAMAMTHCGGLGWHHTKMNDPQRAERLWLALAVATLWLVSVGGKAETDRSASSLPSLGELDT